MRAASLPETRWWTSTTATLWGSCRGWTGGHRTGRVQGTQRTAASRSARSWKCTVLITSYLHKRCLTVSPNYSMLNYRALLHTVYTEKLMHAILKWQSKSCIFLQLPPTHNMLEYAASQHTVYTDKQLHVIFKWQSKSHLLSSTRVVSPIHTVSDNKATKTLFRLLTICCDLGTNKTQWRDEPMTVSVQGERKMSTWFKWP